MKGDQDSIENNEKRNAVIEKDVLRFQQREAVLKKVLFMTIYPLVLSARTLLRYISDLVFMFFR